MDQETDYHYLVERILSGSQEAYSELYDITIQDVYKTAHFLIEEKTDVDDVVQEIYIQLYQSLSKYNRERPFRPWLMGVVIRQIHSYFIAIEKPCAKSRNPIFLAQVDLLEIHNAKCIRISKSRFIVEEISGRKSFSTTSWLLALSFAL